MSTYKTLAGIVSLIAAILLILEYATTKDVPTMILFAAIMIDSNLNYMQMK